MSDESRDPKTHAIIGAAMEVHRNLGCGFLEPVYQEALAIEFTARDIPFHSQVELPIFYKGLRLESKYRPDFICYDDVIVELKALARIGGIEDSQVINYLKAAKQPVGLLINFGCSSLQFKRFVNS